MIKKYLNKYNKLPEPLKASIWYTIGNVFNKGLALIATPIFTRILTEDEYGTYAVYQSWSSILIIFTSLNIFLGGYQKGLIHFKKDENRFTSSQLGLTSIITAIWFIIYICNIDFWTKIFQLSPLLMIFMFLELLVVPGLNFWSEKQRFEYKYKKYVIVTLAISVLSLIGGVTSVLISTNKVEARIFSDIVVKLIIAGGICVLILRKGRCWFDKNYWKYALTFNIPLIPHYLSNFVLNQSDRLMISRMVGNSQAAYYSVAYTISTMMLLITSAINSSLTPYIYKTLEKNGEEEIKKVTKPVLLLIAILCLITIAFAPEIIGIFGGKQYLDAIYVIPPIATSVFFIFLYSLFSNIEYYFQKTGFIAIATCLSAVANLLLNFIFIKKYGYYAAGYTTLVCYIFLAILHYIFYTKVLKQEKIYGDIYGIKAIILLSLIVLVGMLFMVMIYKLTILRYFIFLVIVVLLWINRDKIKRQIFEFRKVKK